MKRLLKRTGAILMAFCMSLSFAMAAYAEETVSGARISGATLQSDGTASWTIEGVPADREVEYYQLRFSRMSGGNWNDSYSEYISLLEPWYRENVSPDFLKYRNEIAGILAEETKLMEIVKLIGSEILPDDQKLTLEIARVIRIGFLQQNAMHETDTYTPIIKHFRMMEVILYLNKTAKKAVAKQIPISKILATGIFDKLVKMKYDIPNDKPELFDGYIDEITKVFENLT